MNDNFYSKEFDAKFTVDAHLISVLGEQLISSEKVGILELVKNAYDAGAKVCQVSIEKIEGLQDKLLIKPNSEVAGLKGPVISIFDNGSGMGRDTLEMGWLRAATTFKTNVKDKFKADREIALREGRLDAFDAIYNELKKANGGRFPLGEKGIGRLATHRLGRYLWLRTKREDEELEWELKIDWELFDNIYGKPIDISNVPLRLRQQTPTFDYGPEGHGTIIRCYGGRDGFDWGLEEVIEIGRALSDLKSPFKQPDDFDVTFMEKYDLGVELTSPVYRVPAHFQVKANIENNGMADIAIEFHPPAHLSHILESRKWNMREDLRDKEDNYWKKLQGMSYRVPDCGSFEMAFNVYYRDVQWLKEDRKEITNYLDVYGGIGLFRDGLAIMPASMIAHIDAFELGVRARKKTSSIAYYNLTGQVELSQKFNSEIMDQTSREGQLKNQQFEDLKKLVKAVVLIVEDEYIKKRDELRKSSLKLVNTPTLRKHSRVATEILEKVMDNYEFEKDELGIKNSLEKEKMKAREYLYSITETMRRVDDHLKIVDEQQKGLIEAAGYGLAVAIAIHELSKSLSTISTMLERSSKNKKPLTDEELESLMIQGKQIESEFKRLAPLRVTRLEKSRKFNVRQAISSAVGVIQSRIKSSEIKLILPDLDECFELTARYTACSQVIANLLDNAVYWLSIPSWEGNDKSIRISCDKYKRILTIEDSGPGLHQSVQDRIFEPFVTKKIEGQGLGLYICDFYLRQMKAKITYQPLENGDYQGARFILDFSKVPEE